jgi:acyl-CoA thioesterase I
MRGRVFFCALTGAIALLPMQSIAQDVSVASAAAVVLPKVPPSLSPECSAKRMDGDRSSLRPLRGIRKALRTQRSVKVLAIGSSSTEGVGASKPSATYIAKLETSLEGAFKGMDFDVVGRGKGGEVAQGAADRMKREVEEVKPDLVVWQVGTNDALRHVDLERFKSCLRTTLAWLAQNKFDVILVDPQYGNQLVKDSYYEKVVAAIAEVASEARVLLVDRFETMRELQRERGNIYLSSDNLHLNDTGHRCMAEQLARSIVAGLLQADAEADLPIFYP